MEGKARKRRTSKRPDKHMLRRTLVLMAVCGIVAFVVLGIRLYILQIKDHDHYEELAVEQQTRQSVITAERGTIYDRNGKVLAMSASVETVFISPYEIELNKEDKQLIATRLSEILDVDYDSILEKMKDTESWYKTIKTKIEEDLASQVRDFINEYKLKGVHLETDTKRYYPYSTLACHVIGFVGSDNYGLEGLEAMYNDYLSGTDGRIVRLKNGWGSDMLFSDFEDYYDAKDGDKVTTTTDVTIQYIVEKYLQQAVEDNDALNGGACIAMDPNTGEILAMASLGNYDLNNYLSLPEDTQAEIDKIENEEERSSAEKEALYRQWRNKALADTYEPGSVFKIITLSIALEEGLVSDNDTFYCGGSIEVRGRDPVNCWQHSGHGTQTLAEAVQNSCNCAFVQIGERIGAELFYDYIESYGLFDSTGVDLSGEGSSIWWSEDVFTDPDNHSQLAAASFGQTFAVTPMQVITAVAASCNGGYLMKPYVVSSIEDADGNTVLVNEPTVRRQVVSQEVSNKVNEILETVVSVGGGKNAYVAGYRIAGKTGTSEKVTENLSGGLKQYVVSFCGYAPANDPKVIVLLLLDNPSHSTGRYISGANMAAPPVGNILCEILQYMGYDPEYSEEDLQAADVYVPSLYGWTEANASGALAYQGLTYITIGSGSTVTSQFPSAYSTVAAGSKVILYMGEPANDTMVTVPDLSGMSYLDAQRRLENMGLFICKKSGLSGSELVVGTQYTDAGTQVAYGSVIEVALVDESNMGEY